MKTLYLTNVYAEVAYDTLIYYGYTREEAECRMRRTWNDWN